MPVISAASLKTLKFYKTPTRGWQHISDLTPEEASSLRIKLPVSSTDHSLASSISEIQEAQSALCDQVEDIWTEMGFLNRKLDELIRMTSLIHRGAQLAVPFQSTDLASATQMADRIIHSTSPAPRFR